MTDEVDPDELLLDEEDTFDDWEDETDDSVELDRYAHDVAVAVEEFDVPILEPGEVRD